MADEKEPTEEQDAVEGGKNASNTIMYRHGGDSLYVGAGTFLMGSDDEVENAPLWLITFTDIMALMLTFFVLMYSMSVPDNEKWEDLTTGLETNVRPHESPIWARGARDTIDIQRVTFQRALNLDYVRGVIEKNIEANEKLQGVTVVRQKKRLVVSLPSALLFERGSDVVSTEGKWALYAIGDILSRVQNRIEIVGHTDPEPFNNQGRPEQSNWGLSLKRAISVADVLRSVGYDRPMGVKGHSSGGYEALPATMPIEQRMALARRVDIILSKDTGVMRSLMKTSN